ADRVLNEIAALVHLGHNPIRCVPPVSLNRYPCPIGWRMMPAQILEHPAIAPVVFAGNNNAGFIGALFCRNCRVDSYDDSLQVWCMITPRPLQHLQGPERPWCILEQLGLNLLPA